MVRAGLQGMTNPSSSEFANDMPFHEVTEMLGLRGKGGLTSFQDIFSLGETN